MGHPSSRSHHSWTWSGLMPFPDWHQQRRPKGLLHISLSVLCPWLCCAQIAHSCLTLCDPMDYSLPGTSVDGDSPGMNTGVGRPALLQGIFPTQWPNPGLQHCRHILYHLSHRETHDLDYFYPNLLLQIASFPGHSFVGTGMSACSKGRAIWICSSMIN